MTPSTSTRRFWETRASALAWRINVAAWLERVAPVGFFVASGAAIAFYALRRAGSPLGPAWLTLVAALGLAAAACAWGARRRFFGAAEARVLLESHLRLDTRLTAATAGLVAWPEVPARLPAVVRWELRNVGGWFAAALAMLVLALYAPVPHDADRVHVTGSPPSLLQAQDMIAALKEMKVAEPQALEQLSDRAREMARRPAEEQYSHSALEAADALRNQLAVAAGGLSRGLDSAASALNAANSSPDMKGAAGRLAAALSGLRDGMLPANKDLLSHLPAGEVDLNSLTPEQRAQLAQQLANLAKQAGGVAGAAGAGTRVAGPDGSRGDFASGGPGGGGDSAPLTFAKDQSDAGDGVAEGLIGAQLKRLALGDKLGTTAGSHDVDPSKAAGSMSAGAVAAPAQGGEAVWVNRLTPAERAALKNFFK